MRPRTQCALSVTRDEIRAVRRDPDRGEPAEFLVRRRQFDAAAEFQRAEALARRIARLESLDQLRPDLDADGRFGRRLHMPAASITMQAATSRHQCGGSEVPLHDAASHQGTSEPNRTGIITFLVSLGIRSSLTKVLRNWANFDWTTRAVVQCNLRRGRGAVPAPHSRRTIRRVFRSWRRRALRHRRW